MGDENVPPGRLSAMGSLHKMNKPLMERRRRQRINDCLNQLKSILETLNHKQSSYLSKLEKADILEMTVHCVKNLRQRQSSDEALLGFNAVQYVEGFDACTREVTDCLQAVTIPPDLYAGLLSHLATCRRRLLLARNRDDQHTTVLPPAECLRLRSDSLDENTSYDLQTTKLATHTRVLTGEQKRSPLLSIANLHPMALSAAESRKKAKSHLNCTSELTSVQQEETRGINVSAAVQSDIDHSQRTEGCMPTSRDVMNETQRDDLLSLATDDDVTSLMWRPW